MSNSDLSGVISDLEDAVDALQEAQNEDVDDAMPAMDSIAYELRQRADELEAMSSALSAARDILS